MSGLGLGGYGSSDEEDESTGATQEVAKTASITEAAPADSASDGNIVSTITADPTAQPAPGPTPAPTTDAAPSSPANNDALPTSPSLSPYSSARAQIHALTMPPIPNFSLPPPPPPPSPGSMASADRKIRHFLSLKKQGVHYNERLLSSPALKDQGTVDELLRYAGIEGVRQYEHALPEGMGVDVHRWAGVRVEKVVGAMEERRKKDAKGRVGKGREFVREGGR
ncbi:Hypothetical protein D9617_10g073460 [Elsinoe fawcettii]|nr:Hypothetical protein D9617_10g073460 [Elsinoe fawcettii]